MSQSLPEDILHKVTLTKIINSAAHASGWAKFYFHVLLFDFVSVLLDNINWDEKEKHQVLVSFYELAHLTRELPSWETSKLGTTTCSFHYKPAAGLFRTVLETPEEHSQGNVWWGVYHFSSQVKWLGRLGRRSSIKNREDRVILYHCSPEGARGLLGE